MQLVKKEKIFIIKIRTNNKLEMKAYLLKDEELNKLQEKIPGWQIKNNHIKRSFIFKDFVEAFSFMTKIALISEKYNHHANLENVYSEVKLKLSTHDLGGISNLDQIIAQEINNIL